MRTGFVIAIDGPAGTGKSSVARRLAERLAYVHVDTGALYRAIAFLSLELGKENFLENAIKIAKSVHLDFFRIPEKNPVNRIFANKRDLTDFIRSQKVTEVVSKASALAEVRSSLLGLQYRLGSIGQCILEGRDIGTVIFPDADLKFFLVASSNERAKRRLAELEALGVDVPSFEEVKNQMGERDRMDSERIVAPLKKAFDAIEIDTSQLTLDEVVVLLENKVREKLNSFILKEDKE
jgi:cytidylate kinase